MELGRLLETGRQIRVVGFDDGPGGLEVPVAGAVCAETVLEGLVWGSLTRDGLDATDVLAGLLVGGKYLPQLHLVLTDGVTMGGLNVLDLAELHAQLGVPCVAVMRRMPDLDRFHRALERVDDGTRRARVAAAGPLHPWEHGVFQVVGEEPTVVARVLPRLTLRGRVPECLRLAHLITGAVATGESGKRA
ncbi:MAG: DUF99 family protein [Myxococcales bacterium]|nr:DUF99 family protein [Myxococcales bacterium]